MFSGPDVLLEMVGAQKRGRTLALPSVCSAHREVLNAALEYARDTGDVLLVEATSNQVNQEGGYTGMTPADFAARMVTLAREAGVAEEQVLLGGDHLGPNPWRRLPAEQALEKACTMVADYVRAGFNKIHLDASMACGGEAHPSTREVAGRAAQMAVAAENASGGRPLVYVVGTEVPTPGGAQTQHGLHITTAEDARGTHAAFQESFLAAGLQEAWERVIALVVQPGVEFGDADIHAFQPAQAGDLSRALDDVPGVVFEAHSTDYQTEDALRELVRAHFGILKVGPWLTWAWREALFALEHIEAELLTMRKGIEPSRLSETALETMHADPGDWQAYYRGSREEIDHALRYSLSDRIRYYWLREPLLSATERLFANLKGLELPYSLLSQFLPRQAEAVLEGRLPAQPLALAKAQVRYVLETYARACGRSA